MALMTLHKDFRQVWSVEEDASGRLWLEVVCGTTGLYSVHHELTRGEKREFLNSPENLEPLVRRILARPNAFTSKQNEAEYRAQSGG